MFSLDELSPRRQLGQLRDDLRDDKFGAILTIIKLALLIVSGATLLLILPKLAYSLLRAATDTGLGDAPVFWTVGRGWVDGLKPYIDLFDVKPPGIFMITALSELLTNGNLLGVTVSVLATILTGIVPLVFVIYLIRKDSLPKTDSLIYICFFFSYGIMFSFFSCSSMMPDSIGAGFASAYALVLAYSAYRYPQDPKWTILLATAAMLLSAGIKEPFLFSCLAVSLVICENPPRFLKYFIIPLAVSSVIGCIALAALGILKPYLTFYLPFMAVDYTNSPWLRGFEFERIISYMNEFAGGMGTLVVATFAVFVAIIIIRVKKNFTPVNLLFSLVRIVGVPYFATLAVGTSGRWWAHHYYFAVPVFIALLLYIGKEAVGSYKTIRYRAVPPILYVVLIIIMAYSTVSIMEKYEKRNVKQQYLNAKGVNYHKKREQEYAETIDRILDVMKLDKYGFLGRMGVQPWIYTRHFPEGPFFYDFPFLGKPTARNREKYWPIIIDKVDRSSFIIFQKYNFSGPLRNIISNKLKGDFSTEPWEEVRDLHQQLLKDYKDRYKFYYRKGANSHMRRFEGHRQGTSPIDGVAVR